MEKSIGQLFMERTGYHHFGPADQALGLPQPPLELEYDREAPTLALPDPKTIVVDPVSVQDAIARRRSLRKYAETPVSLGELSFLLWSVQGVRRVLPGTTFRNPPSAGARHCFETLLLVNRVDGLEPGLYRYLALEHQLLTINPGSAVKGDVVRGCLGQEFVGESAVAFIWIADAYRMTWRYGDRGYRYLLLDAGHVCQNLYLAAETVACGVCAVAAFDDDVLNGVLGLDGERQFVVYAGTVGKR